MTRTVPARYTIPDSVAHELVRANLLSQLDRPFKVTAVVAPSGYGKSVIAAQWARRQPNVIWIRLTQEDRDAQYLVHALADAIRVHGIPLGNWSAHAIRDTPVSRMVNDLLGDVNLWPDDLTFVLDGGEDLSPDSAAVLASFVDGLNGHRFIVLQHEASPFEVAPYVLRGTGQEMSVRHLTFTAEESSALSSRFRVGASESAALHGVLSGWPAGMMLSLYVRDQQLSLEPADLFRALVQRLDEQIQTQLPALSVMDLWTEATPAALHLTFPPNWLSELRRVGLPLTAHGQTCAPHDVLKLHLRQELAKTPDHERQMHRYAGVWSEHQGEPYTTVKHFLAADDTHAALKVVGDLLPGWYRTANWQVARDVLSQFPAASLTSELRSILALAYGETNEGIKAEELAKAQLAIEETATAYFTLALRSNRTNSIDEMGEYIDRGLRIAVDQRDLIQLTRSKGLWYHLNRMPQEALSAAREAVQRAKLYGDHSLRLSTQSLLAHLERYTSSNADNARNSEQLYLTAKETESPHRLMSVIQNYAIDLTRVNRVKEAVILLRDFVDKYRESYPLCEQYLLPVLSSAYRSAGEIDKSLNTALYAAQINREAGHFKIQDTCTTVVVWHYLGQGLKEKAREFALEFLSFAAINGYSFTSYLGNAALYHYAAGDFAKAQELNLESIAAQEKDQKEPLVFLVQSLLEYGFGAITSGTAAALAESLRKFPEDHGMVHVAWSLFRPVLDQIIENNIERNFFLNLVEEIDNPKPEHAYALKIVTLGSLSMSVDGLEGAPSYGTAMEALIFHLLHPQALQDDLAQTIWKGADLYKARGSAQRARGELNKAFRKLTGNRTIDLILTSGPGRRNPSWHINPDVCIAFDALLILRSSNAAEIHNFYGGPFLQGKTHDWVNEEREDLNQHISKVYQRQAEDAGTTREGLKWLMRAAIIDQEVATFEKALQLSVLLGDSSVRQGAEQALAALAQGDEVRLQGWLN
ncbi:hypothetical protein [Deinococcus humi]|uniref:MalT-like TPR region domain-containing protein n=1 Tax=Deinococcus humi TaxID=662880 RepID=A0A7W8NHY0_9DEIO|nr:hypothetical protein [Deinococcus humi]MBB5364487.1 hypothetical protein [Deinococcus humi]GGO32937.1 hypothetical protein GCM10008949_31340 [Deinococcus humi]